MHSDQPTPSASFTATSTVTSIAPKVCAVVLAGGRGSRMGGVDKGLQPFEGHALAWHAVQRLRAQSGGAPGLIGINANRNAAQYATWGLPVWPDAVADYAGPLAGFLAGLHAAQAAQSLSDPLPSWDYLLTVPCDSPLFPLDLLARLAEGLHRAGADIAMACAPETLDDGRTVQRKQPVFCLLRTRLLPSLRDFLDAGGRKIDAWTAQHVCVEVPFDRLSDVAAFSNANTLAQLQALSSSLSFSLSFSFSSLSSSTPVSTLSSAHSPAMPTLDQIAAALPDYNPNALRADTALAFLQAMVRPVQEVETVALRDALDRVLAHEVVSPIHVPGHDNSAMDGYAFASAALQRGADTTLDVAQGTAFAGKAWAGSVGPMQCVRIMTGAVMPAGLDTVVPQEWVRVQEGAGRISIPPGTVQPGDNRRLQGEDLRQGQVALAAGSRITPAALGLLASLGIAQVQVRRRLRVAWFSTGDEVLSVGDAPREGAVYDSNRYTLLGLLQRMGVELWDMGVVRDEPEALRRAFTQAAAQADAIITSGGVSVGEADHTKAVMRELADAVFWKVAMRPGRPMAVGRLGQAALLGLPGNPVAVMVTFLAFVRPALLRMMGMTDSQAAPAPLLQAHSLHPIRKKPGRTEYQRGIVSSAPDGRLQVQTTGQQGSGVLSSMVQANGLIVLHHDQGDVQAGQAVDVMMFDGVV